MSIIEHVLSLISSLLTSWSTHVSAKILPPLKLRRLGRYRLLDGRPSPGFSSSGVH